MGPQPILLEKFSSYDPRNFSEERVSQFVDNVDLCMYCMRAFTEEDRMQESVKMFQSTNCFHSFHSQCFFDMADKELCTENRDAEEFEFKEAKCGECGLTIEHWECKEIVGDKKWEEIEKRRMDIVTARDPKLVKCACGNVMELEAGKPDYEMKTEKGEQYSKEAAEHFAQNRLRCP